MSGVSVLLAGLSLGCDASFFGEGEPSDLSRHGLAIHERRLLRAPLLTSPVFGPGSIPRRDQRLQARPRGVRVGRRRGRLTRRERGDARQHPHAREPASHTAPSRRAPNHERPPAHPAGTTPSAPRTRVRE